MEAIRIVQFLVSALHGSEEQDPADHGPVSTELRLSVKEVIQIA